MVTKGCISVEAKRIVSDLTVGWVGKNTPISASAIKMNYLAISCVWRNKGLKVDTLMQNPGQVSAVCKNKPLNVTFGIVCSVAQGFAVLYASDGALITIEGNYLIVKDER